MKPCRVLARHQRAFRQASEEPAIISTFCTRAHKNQARIPVRWESPVIKKVWVVRNNNSVIFPGSEQINVPHMLRVETILPQDFATATPMLSSTRNRAFPRYSASNSRISEDVGITRRFQGIARVYACELVQQLCPGLVSPLLSTLVSQ